jgi:hypothetical protein
LRTLSFASFGLASVVSLLSLSAAAAQTSQDLHINQIQVIGTHNSYHVGLPPETMKLLQTQENQFLADALDYTHPKLEEQFDAGVRKLELDVFSDSKGGLYAHPGGPGYESYNKDGAMNKPGFKVMHVQDIDQQSWCASLVQCLTTVRTWSKAHPQHVPIFILVEAKFGKLEKLNLKGLPLNTTPEDFTPTVFDALDAEIRSVFPANEIITPDEVRGKYATLPEAIVHNGWPLLSQSRGKIVFVMDNRVMTPIYTKGHPALRGRVIFTNSIPGDPDAAFTEQNGNSKAEIDALVMKGYLVRTRSDDNMVQARKNDTSRRDETLRSGAQIISTDYPANEPAKWNGHYSISLPGGVPVRCNPLNAPAHCKVSE